MQSCFRPTDHIGNSRIDMSVETYTGHRQSNKANISVHLLENCTSLRTYILKIRILMPFLKKHAWLKEYSRSKNKGPSSSYSEQIFLLFPEEQENATAVSQDEARDTEA